MASTEERLRRLESAVTELADCVEAGEWHKVRLMIKGILHPESLLGKEE